MLMQRLASVNCFIMIFPLIHFLCIHITHAADPPQVTVHPVNQTDIVPGSDVSFSVTSSDVKPKCRRPEGFTELRSNN